MVEFDSLSDQKTPQIQSGRIDGGDQIQTDHEKAVFALVLIQFDGGMKFVRVDQDNIAGLGDDDGSINHQSGAAFVEILDFQCFMEDLRIAVGMVDVGNAIFFNG